MVFRSKPLRVGVPMVGVVLFGYWSLTSVLKGRIQDHDAQHLNDSPKIPESNKNKGKLDMQVLSYYQHTAMATLDPPSPLSLPSFRERRYLTRNEPKEAMK